MCSRPYSRFHRRRFGFRFLWHGFSLALLAERELRSSDIRLRALEPTHALLWLKPIFGARMVGSKWPARKAARVSFVKFSQEDFSKELRCAIRCPVAAVIGALAD